MCSSDLFPSHDRRPYQILTNSEYYKIYSGVRLWVLRPMAERERTQTIS